MKIYSLFLLLAVCVCGQSVKCILRGEANEKSVKLKWIPEVWSANTEGVYIKRRLITKAGSASAWETLNKEIIYPELSFECVFLGPVLKGCLLLYSIFDLERSEG